MPSLVVLLISSLLSAHGAAAQVFLKDDGHSQFFNQEEADYLQSFTIDEASISFNGQQQQSLTWDGNMDSTIHIPSTMQVPVPPQGPAPTELPSPHTEALRNLEILPTAAKRLKHGEVYNYRLTTAGIKMRNRAAKNMHTSTLPSEPPCTSKLPVVNKWKDNWMPADPKVAVLFMTRNRVMQPEVWRIWLANAKNKVNVYIHASQNVTETDKRTNWPNNYIEADKVTGGWGDLNRIMHSLLVKALMHDPNNAFFLYVSDSTIPLRPFCEIYDQLMELPTTRIPYIPNVLTQWSTPKHAQWITLIRPHAEALAQNPEQWTCGKWATIKHGVAAPDEHLPLYTLLRIYGESRLHPHLNAGTTGLDNRLFDHTVAVWNSDLLKKLGHRATRTWPIVFDELTEEGLENLISNKYQWFLRKIVEGAVVIEESDEDSIEDYHYQEWPLSRWLLNEGHLLCKVL